MFDPRAIKHIVIVMLIVLWPVLCLVKPAGSADHAENFVFYYFNPDSSQSNLARLKSEMDICLGRLDPALTFQPFTHQVDFNRKIQEGAAALVFLPYWYLQKHAETLGLRPLLIPVRNHKTSYRKTLLVGRNSGLTLNNLGGAALAMTPMGVSSSESLKELLRLERAFPAEKIRVVLVPKDSDALFALALGQVDMALVAEENLEMISRINPRIAQAVRPLLATSPIPLPVLCYREGKMPMEKIERLKKAILEDRVTAEQFKEILQIDDWQTVTQ